jgi:hypothetical protein
MTLRLFSVKFKKIVSRKFDSATWYSTHTCSTLRGSTLKKMFPYKNFYFKWGQYTCGASERLTAFGARTFLVLSTTIMDHKVQLIKPLNLPSCIPCSRTENFKYFFGIIRKLGSFYTFLILSIFKISSFSYRIFEYTTFSGEILLRHNTANELWVAGFVNSIVT